MKDLHREAFNQMIDRVREDLHPGNTVRAVIYNEYLDLPIFVPCRPMDTDVIMNSLVTVLKSQQDILFDSSVHVDIGTIKYPKAGRGITCCKMSTVEKKTCNVKDRFHGSEMLTVCVS